MHLSKVRPHLIALEDILLFTVILKLAVISYLWVQRPLPVSKRTPAQ